VHVCDGEAPEKVAEPQWQAIQQRHRSVSDGQIPLLDVRTCSYRRLATSGKEEGGVGASLPCPSISVESASDGSQSSINVVL
jgi:hypothetical protein